MVASTSEQLNISDTSDVHTEPRPAKPEDLRIVGIGASSGGLNALEAFFRSMPPESGMTFVVVMHLSQEHESQLAHVIQGFTTTPVTQVISETEMVPDHAYVISPGHHLSVSDGRLHVSRRERPPTLKVIDHLFHSLAEDLGERAVGIILSGNGADGTLGMKAIKERGGLLLAQDPDEAEYTEMPLSIIATGLVDYVVGAEEMPARLTALRDHLKRPVPANWAVSADAELALREILSRLHALTGYEFSHYKRNTLLRQISRRMLVQQAEGLPAYARLVKRDDGEVKALFRSLLIGVTRFFRDPEAFLMLDREVLPRLFREEVVRREDDPPVVRVWVPGCATGEEVYSLAMLLVEHREAAGAQVPLQVLATDIDDSALDIARRGRYPDAVTAGLSPARLQRFFVEKEGAFQVTDDLRAVAVFAAHDLTRDPPFSRIDLLSCRNLLMYFEAGMQQHVLERCAFSLRPGGYLFLGTAEGIGSASQFFAPVSKKLGLYRRTVTPCTITSRNFFPITRTLPGAYAAPAPSSRQRPLSVAEDGDASAVHRIHTNSPKAHGNAEPTHRDLMAANREMQSLNVELRSMMEELEVAKEELQSLNEELTTVNQELQNKIEEHRRVNSNLHILIESTHLATLFLDQELNVVLYTPESTKLFNLLPVDIGRPLEHLTHRLIGRGILDCARQVLEQATEVKREVQAQDGSWYSMRAMPYPSADEPAEGVVITFADITSQKKVEQVSEDRFAIAFHAGPMAAGIVTRDDGRFVDANHVFEQITGYSRAEIVGTPASDFGLSFGDDLDPASAGSAGDRAFQEMEVRIRTRSGVQRDLVVSTTAIDFGGQACYLSFFYDVTERTRLEREILLVSDREQRRIGIDLHDGLGAHLTGIALMARGLARQFHAGRTVDADEMDEIVRLLAEAIEQARMLAQGLNPFLLEVRGLTIALRDLASNVEAQTGIACSFEEDGDGMVLNSEQSMHLYRIAQEALTNAVRHAEATRLRVTLSRKTRRYELTVRDDGKGFQSIREEDAPRDSAGMGLSIMRYRAERIGARLNVTSSPDGGTTVTCSFRASV